MTGYDEMRLELQTSLLRAGKLTGDEVEAVMTEFCMAAQNFEITRKTLDLIPVTGMPKAVDEYLACLKLEGRAAGTIYNYKRVLYGLFTDVRKDPTELTHKDIWGYLLRYQARAENPVSNRTMNSYLGVIKYFYCWMQDIGYMVANPTKAIAPIRYDKKQLEAMTRHDLVVLTKACKTAREKAVISLMYATGCRVSEVARMKKPDINWSAKTITVFGKGSKYRQVFFNDQAEIYMRDYLDSRTDESPYVFVSERGKHGVNPAAIRKWVETVYARVADEIGTKVTPHIIRHTTATLALQSGMPITSVQRVLGHEQIGTTMEYVDMKKIEVEQEYTKFVV